MYDKKILDHLAFLKLDSLKKFTAEVISSHRYYLDYCSALVRFTCVIHMGLFAWYSYNFL